MAKLKKSKIQAIYKQTAALEDLDEWEKVCLFQIRVWEELNARPQQTEPKNWRYDGQDVDIWYLLGGRGSGKTRTGSQTIGKWASMYANTRWACVSPTFSDTRDTMFEGESGLLNVIPEQAMLGGDRERAFNRSQLQLRLRNGSAIYGYSSEKASRLRGPQFHGWWMDEPASLKDRNKLPMEPGTTFSNLVFGSRLTEEGWNRTRGLITGTPEPCILLAGSGREPGLLSPEFEALNVYISRMSSLDNIDNLSVVYRKLIDELKGTRIGRQEIEAELLTDVPGALWKQSWIVVDQSLEPNHAMSQVVVAIDPAGSTAKTSDETGIVVAALDTSNVMWVLEDLSGKYTPEQWAGLAWDAAVRWDADTIVFEKNYGGDMGPEILRLHRGSISTLAEVEVIHASKGKAIRAKPASALYEPSDAAAAGSRVRHADHFPLLVDQMVRFTKRSANDDRVDALVWALIYLSEYVHLGWNEAGEAPDPWFNRLGSY